MRVLDYNEVKNNIEFIRNLGVVDDRMNKLFKVLVEELIPPPKRHMVESLELERIYKTDLSQYDKVLVRGKIKKGKVIHLTIVDKEKEPLVNTFIAIYTTLKKGKEFENSLTQSEHILKDFGF